MPKWLLLGLWLSSFICCGYGQTETAAKQSAGLFVGIGRFGFQSGLKDLEYAPDDAVALAYRFVVELKVLEANRTQLVLGGKPSSELARKQLEVLRDQKVSVMRGTKYGLQKALKEFAVRTSSPGNLAVMSFSGHGYEMQQDVYLMPTDGNWQTVRSTGMSFESVLETLRQSRAKSKVLLFDACRQVPDRASLDVKRANEDFRNRVKAVEGLAVLASCSAGEKSWQAKTLEHGVFTHFVLQEMVQGKAFYKVSEGVVQSSREWMSKYGELAPTAWHEGGEGLALRE